MGVTVNSDTPLINHTQGEKGMGYIEDSLVPGETELYRANVSPMIFVLPAVLLGILIWFATRINTFVAIVVVIASLVMLIQLLLVYWTTEFALTNRRIIAKRGLIRRHSLEILLTKLESVSVSQSIAGRIFGFGTVTVVGSGGTKEFFNSIDKPMDLRKMVNGQIAKVS